ncbi:MAG: hypothetical protein HC790_12565 [Acaryochloridaceae cyanobacterium CSU_3_4]|nr:hypothetical protein [Acaryochloridaceae cyanobacterium CSU_3_4]
MSQPESNNQGMKWMMAAMVACCAIPIAIALSVGGGLGVFLGRSSQQTNSNPPARSTQTLSKSQTTPAKALVSLEPAGNWRVENHVHGLAINAKNPEIIYVATHNGLLQGSPKGEWFWMGKQRADYMGFTADPTNSDRFYSSGHPPTGGNLGFQVSDTQGEDWQQISLPGVDFHALAIAPSNPNIFYGWPASGAEGLHFSEDGGKTWTQPQMAGLADAPFGLAVDPRNPDHVFATTRTGLFESSNRGDNWSLVLSTKDAPVVGLALLKTGNGHGDVWIPCLKANPGLYRSTDNGKTWKPLGSGTQGLILQLAIASSSRAMTHPESAPSNPQWLYAINKENEVFQSQDGGKIWTVIK